MRTNNEIVDIVISLCEEKGYSLSEFSKLIGMPKSSLSRYFNKNREFPINKIGIFAEALNVTEEYLLGFELNEKNEIIDIYTKLSCCRKRNVVNYAAEQLFEQNRSENIQLVAEYEEPVAYVVSGRQSAAGTAIEVDDSLARQDVMPASMVPKGADELVEITGDSMEPLIAKGSSVYIRHQPTIENGEIAIISILDAGVTCKHVCFDESGKIVLKSENDKYEDMIFDADQVRVIGKVLLK